MSEEAFNEAYARLNGAQKEAVDAIEGPVMVVAGPGTGKTQILTLRIAQILLKTDTKPEHILALTFTESGARAMRERLRSYIGSEAYRVPIHTFHSFAGLLIRTYPEAYERVIGGRPASDIEKIEIFEEILDDSGLKVIRPMSNPTVNLKRIMDAIQFMKKEYISPNVFAKIIEAEEQGLNDMPRLHEKGAHAGKVRSEYAKKERHIAKNKELLFVYRKYQALLLEYGLYDYEDMIIETTRALEKNEDMLRDLQETHQYILADEHQDVNESQNRILELLASYHSSPNIFVVGDEKQAIYRFQGASLENFLYFEELFADTKTIALLENYRSGQVILDASHSLIAVNAGPAAELRVPLSAVTGKESGIEKRAFVHEALEDMYVVNKIETLLTGGVSAEEIAIIVRTNREVEAYAAKLRRAGIAAAASAEGDILTHPVTHAVRALIAAINGKSSEEALFNVLSGTYWNISPSDLVRITTARSHDTPLSALIADRILLRKAGVKDIESVLKVMEVLQTARERVAAEPPHRVLSYVFSESGFLDSVLKTDPLEGTRVVRRLYDEIEALERSGALKTLSDVEAMLARLVSHNLPLNAPYINARSDAVQVMTAHKAKGLEFEHVFVPHLVDSKWGGARRAEYFDIPLTKHLSDTTFDLIDDERRLLYVAMTRAKHKLYLSYAEANGEGRPLTPTRLFEDIDHNYVMTIDTKEVEADFNPVKELRGKDAKASINAKLIKSIFLERGLSATGLNNYLKSPWEYFFKNILRIPKIQETHLLFGTAVHGVLERTTALHTKEKRMPTGTEIKQFLDLELGKLPLHENEYVRLHEEGLNALVPYIQDMELPKKTKEEMRFRVVLKTGKKSLPEIPLTGMLDRIDFDAEGKVIRVVDYKTGKPKTRGFIEGKTKDSNGEYKRQLVFYALLLSLYDDPNYACTTGVLSFVQPDTKGAIREEVYEITKEEINDLKKEIIDIAGEIVNGSFLKEKCDDKKTNFCELAERFRV